MPSEAPRDEGGVRNRSEVEYTPTHLGPDMTLPGAFLGLLVGVGFAMVSPEQAKTSLTLGIAVGWLFGFAATLIADSS